MVQNQSKEYRVVPTASTTLSLSTEQLPGFASVAATSSESNQFKEILAILSKMTQNITSNTEPPRYLTVQDAAAYCRVAVQTIYNNRKYIARMPGVRKLLFTREALDDWLATRPSARRRRK